MTYVPSLMTITLTVRESFLFELNKKLFPYRCEQIVRGLNIGANVVLFSAIGEMLASYRSNIIYSHPDANIPLESNNRE